MDFVIACRTYKRHNKFANMAYQTIKDNELLDRLYIFVANEEERLLYEEALANYEHRPCIIGELGGHNATKAICNYFPEGQAIFFIDDDMTRFYNFSSPTTFVKKATNLKAFIEDGFKTIDENNFGSFTFSGYTNKLYLKNKPFKEFVPYTLTGGWFGCRNDRDLIPVNTAHLDDCIRGCKYINKYGGILLYWWAGFNCDYGSEPGGLQSLGRENPKQTAEQIWNDEPLISKFYNPPAIDRVGLWAFKRKQRNTIYKILSSDGLAIRKYTSNDFIA